MHIYAYLCALGDAQWTFIQPPWLWGQEEASGGFANPPNGSLSRKACCPCLASPRLLLKPLVSGFLVSRSSLCLFPGNLRAHNQCHWSTSRQVIVFWLPSSILKQRARLPCVQIVLEGTGVAHSLVEAIKVAQGIKSFGLFLAATFLMPITLFNISLVIPFLPLPIPRGHLTFFYSFEHQRSFLSYSRESQYWPF